MALPTRGVAGCAGVALMVFGAGLGPGCIRVTTEPIRVEPIYIEITVNHRIQRELDDFFSDLDAASKATEYVPLEP